MKPKLKLHFTNELETARSLLNSGEDRFEMAWKHLERAHILSQAYPWPHLRVHLWMFYFAWKNHDPREMLGQLPRILVAAPGSWLGRAPLGNTGGANVGILQPMQIPEDLRLILALDDRSP